MQFPDRQMLDQAFWNFMQLSHPQKGSLPYERGRDHNILALKFINSRDLLLISRCLGNPFLSGWFWLFVLEEAAKLVTFLHKNQLTLGLFLKFCLLVDIENTNEQIDILLGKGVSKEESWKRAQRQKPPRLVFFYFQSIEALRYQCSKLSKADQR